MTKVVQDLTAIFIQDWWNLYKYEDLTQMIASISLSQWMILLDIDSIR